MTLIDRIVRSRDGGLPGAGASEAMAAPRHILPDAARDACLRIGLAAASPARPRTPALWIEWSGEDEQGESRRLAMLVRSDHERGTTIHLFRSDEMIGFERAEAYLRFDTDPGGKVSVEFEPEWAEHLAAAHWPRFVRAQMLRRCGEELHGALALLNGFLRMSAPKAAATGRAHLPPPNPAPLPAASRTGIRPSLA